MRTRITWFVVGFVLSWITFSIIQSYSARPRDYSQSHPLSKSDLIPDGIELVPKWLKDAYARKLGRIEIFSSADSSIASAWIHPSGSMFPAVTLLDDDSDGCIDEIIVLDSSGRSFKIYDDDGDGDFNAWHYSSEIAVDTMLLFDGDMDGLYDWRVTGPVHKRSMKIDSKWCEITYKDDRYYVDINGKLTEVELVDRLWKITAEKETTSSEQ